MSQAPGPVSAEPPSPVESRAAAHEASGKILEGLVLLRPWGTLVTQPATGKFWGCPEEAQWSSWWGARPGTSVRQSAEGAKNVLTRKTSAGTLHRVFVLRIQVDSGVWEVSFTVLGPPHVSLVLRDVFAETEMWAGAVPPAAASSDDGRGLRLDSLVALSFFLSRAALFRIYNPSWFPAVCRVPWRVFFVFSR